MGLFGAYDGVSQGTISIDGKAVKIKSPQDAIREGLALVSEDRKKFGLVLNMNIQKNTSIASLKAVSGIGALLTKIKRYKVRIRICNL